MAFPFPDFRHEPVINLFKCIRSTLSGSNPVKELKEDSSSHYWSEGPANDRQLDFHRTSRELMMVLGKHSGGINVGPYSDYITRAELRNYLVRAAERIEPQDKADLLQVLRDFDRIAKGDSKEGKGISYRRMAMYVVENQEKDRLIVSARENNQNICIR